MPLSSVKEGAKLEIFSFYRFLSKLPLILSRKYVINRMDNGKEAES